MKTQADNNAVDNLKQCMKLTAAAAATATKCSETTARRIVNCSKKSEFVTLLQTPGKNKRNKQKTITDLDSLD